MKIINISYIFLLIKLKEKKYIYWGLGIGDWGLGIGDWAQSPIPNPQSPIPNPQCYFQFIIKFVNNFNKKILNND